MDAIFMRLAGLSLQKTLLFGAVLGGLYYYMGFDDGAKIDEQIQKVQAEIQVQEAKEKESDAATKEVEKVRAAVGALSDQFKIVSQALPAEIQNMVDEFINFSSGNLTVSNSEQLSGEDYLHAILDFRMPIWGWSVHNEPRIGYSATEKNAGKADLILKSGSCLLQLSITERY